MSAYEAEEVVSMTRSPGRPARPIWAALALAAALCVAASCAASPGAGSQGVSIRVSPASIVAVARDGASIGPVLVTNPGTFAVDVQGSVEAGGHDPAGVPVHNPVEDPGATAVYVTLDPAEFRLPPGGSRVVHARVYVKRGFSGGAYPVILFRARRVVALPDGNISATSQIAVLTLLTVSPHGRAARLEAVPLLTSVAVEGSPGGEGVRVVATCRNTGNIHASLGGVILIRERDGRVAAQASLASALCLPGCSRELVGLVDPARLQEGTYVAEVRLGGAGREVDSALVAFRVSGGTNVALTRINLRQRETATREGEPPGAPRIARLSVPVVSEGRDLPFEVAVENPDGSRLDPIGYVEIWDYQMKRVGVVALAGTSIAPGAPGVIHLTWPAALSPGYYTARATLQWRSERVSASTAFVVGEGIMVGSKR